MPVLHHFRRITSSGQLIPEIDGLRFIAIFAVVLHHVALFADDTFPTPGPTVRAVSAWAHSGAFGVQLFFVISGFILGIPFARQHILGGSHQPVGAYFLRRLTRLEPAYLASLGLLFILKVAVRGASSAQLTPHLMASAFYVHNIAYNTVSTINGVAWSLEVEFQFYVLAPLLATLFSIRTPLVRRASIVSLALAALALASLDPYDFIQRAHLKLSLLMSLQYFLAGFLLADIYVSSPSLGAMRRGAILLDVACVSILLGLFALAETTPVGFVRELIGATGIFFLYWAAFYARAFRAFLRNPLVVTLGGMCYSLYLTHNSLILAVGAVVNRIPNTGVRWMVLPALSIPAVVVFGGFYFLAIERPTMRRDWPQRLYRTLRRVPTSS